MTPFVNETAYESILTERPGYCVDITSTRCGGLPTVFLAKKYRLKPPKYIILGTPKKPDKTPKNGQNRF